MSGCYTPPSQRKSPHSPDLLGLRDARRGDYAPWEEPRLVIDTARVTPDEAVALIERQIAAVSTTK